MTRRKCLGAYLLWTLMGCSGYGAGPLVETRALGTMVTRASSVTINGTPAISDTTVFRGDVLRTPDDSTAVVRLRSGASLILTGNSEVALDLADAAAGTESINLRRGAINLRNPNSRPERVKVTGASVLVQGEGGFPAVCRIAAVGESSAIMNDRGRVEIRGPGFPLIVPVGKVVRLEAGSPQGGTTPAGAVTAELPRGNVQRSGQSTSIPLKLSDKVYLDDLVLTEAFGRVRITLGDGSVLNIGAHSQMRIVTQNQQSQQTALQLTAGKLRSQVQKITNQGGSFKVTTNTAVIGVTGTDFLVASAPKLTRVWCFEGHVTVVNLNPAISGQVQLNAGQFTSVPLDTPPAAATSASPGEMQSQMSQTNVSGLGTVGTFATVATAGAAAGGAAGATTAIVKSDNAASSLNQATALLNSAATSASNANSNASNAVNSANSANQASGNTNGILTNILQTLVSPTYPCGCH